MKEVFDFFKTIYSCADPEWFIEIRKLEPAPVEWHLDRVKNLQNWVETGLKMSERSESLHFRVCPSETEDRNTLTKATTLWADIEKELSDREIWAMERLKLLPSAIVHSGRGMHLYFALKEPLDLARTKALNEALARYLGGDVRAGHPSHTLRFPGSYNCKYIVPKKVTVEVFNRFYEPEFFSFLPEVKQTRDKKEQERKFQNFTGFSATKLKNLTQKCPILRTAFEKPEKLSYHAWFSLAAITDEKSFLEISSLDKTRFDESKARDTWRYLHDKNYRPYRCEKIKEAISCPKKKTCGLYRVGK